MAVIHRRDTSKTGGTTPQDTRYSTLRLEPAAMERADSDPDSEADGDDERINERLDRLVDFLATYLP